MSLNNRLCINDALNTRPTEIVEDSFPTHAKLFAGVFLLNSSGVFPMCNRQVKLEEAQVEGWILGTMSILQNLKRNKDKVQNNNRTTRNK